MFSALVEFIYGIMRGIVRINNPFSTYFSLILRDIFITKQTFRYREDVSNLFWHSSNWQEIIKKFTGIYMSVQKEYMFLGI